MVPSKKGNTVNGAINTIKQQVINALHNAHEPKILIEWINGSGLPEEVVQAALWAVCPREDPCWVDFYDDVARGIMIHPPEQLRASKATQTLEHVRMHLIAYWHQCLQRYAEALKIAWTPGLVLSNTALHLYGLIIQVYLRNGWLHRKGIDSVYGVFELRLDYPVLEEAFRGLERSGLVQQTGPFTFALLPVTRARLFEHFHLHDEWCEQAHRMASFGAPGGIKQRLAAPWILERLAQELATIEKVKASQNLN
jgi:hypothetical protein